MTPRIRPRHTKAMKLRLAPNLAGQGFACFAFPVQVIQHNEGALNSDPKDDFPINGHQEVAPW